MRKLVHNRQFFFLSFRSEKVCTMAVKERKGIKKHKRQGSFISEYNYEIIIVVLIALGIFLLVEDLEIKHYMYLGLRWFLFSLKIRYRYYQIH